MSKTSSDKLVLSNISQHSSYYDISKHMSDIIPFHQPFSSFFNRQLIELTGDRYPVKVIWRQCNAIFVNCTSKADITEGYI